MRSLTHAAIAATLLHAVDISAQECSVKIKSEYPAPVVAEGWNARLIVSGLAKPRGILFDKNKNLLVVEAGSGIKQIKFASDDTATCLVTGKDKTLITMRTLTHSIELSADGKTLYASNAERVYRWDYNADEGTLTNQRILIENMTNPGHISRTLLLSKKHPDLLLVSRGSGDNIDDAAAEKSSGISQIRAFNISALSGTETYDYPSQGTLVGWGLRNSVGVAEHPGSGGLYSVENSADQINRLGTDIHEDNPGEELNFHGTLPSNTTGANFGYPHCLAVWSTSIPSPAGLTVGSQFAFSASATDATCKSEFSAPRLTFQAHTAPLDIKFDSSGGLAYVSFHGSWNRDQPAGYRLAAIQFNRERGEPEEPSDSKKAAVDVLTNPDLSGCPGKCFRPAGLAVDSMDRVFMSSDSTGEIYVVQRMTGGGANDGTGVKNVAGRVDGNRGGWGVVGLTVVVSVLGGMFFAMA